MITSSYVGETATTERMAQIALFKWNGDCASWTAPGRRVLDSTLEDERAELLAAVLEGLKESGGNEEEPKRAACVELLQHLAGGLPRKPSRVH